MRSLGFATCVLLAGCGDNLTVPPGPAVERADTLFVAAHSDDDLIFMQPELLAALGAGSVATIYVTTGDPIEGVEYARALMAAARVAYENAAGIDAWNCGDVTLAASTVHHCRATNRPVAIVALDIVDGGVPGERRDSLLHLVDGTVASLPVIGNVEGRVTVDSTIALLAELLDTIAPREIHALELAGTHGRDHSSHMFSSAFTLWAAARVGFVGPMTWHRGYNVDAEPITLVGGDYAAALDMLGYYEACAYGCGPCGSSCKESSTHAHVWWLQRQYEVSRVLEAEGRLRGTAGCLTAGLAMADCIAGEYVRLERDGSLHMNDECLASTADGSIVRTACARDASQYWVLDDEGMLWNGSVPVRAPEMAYTHVRCLSGDSGMAGAPTCGARHQPKWRFEPISAPRDRP